MAAEYKKDPDISGVSSFTRDVACLRSTAEIMQRKMHQIRIGKLMARISHLSSSDAGRTEANITVAAQLKTMKHICA